MFWCIACPLTKFLVLSDNANINVSFKKEDIDFIHVIIIHRSVQRRVYGRVLIQNVMLLAIHGHDTNNTLSERREKEGRKGSVNLLIFNELVL